MSRIAVVLVVLAVVAMVAAMLTTLLGFAPGFPEAYYRHIFRSGAAQSAAGVL